VPPPVTSAVLPSNSSVISLPFSACLLRGVYGEVSPASGSRPNRAANRVSA
jgi:hypothetical protein